MKIKKCYIAGKIGSLPESEYKEKFAKAKKKVIKMFLDPVNPVELPHLHDHSWESYMKEDLAELLKCDYLYACKDWRESKGATIEVNLALALKITVIFQ